MRQDKKLTKCKYCGNQMEKHAVCPYCGMVLDVENSAVLIYGSSLKDRVEVSVILTERYIIVRKQMNSAVQAGMRQFGLVGSLVAEGINSAKAKPCGFYDLREVYSVIYPYRAKGIRKNTGMKFINVDNSEFILTFQNKKIARKMCGYFQQIGIWVYYAEDQRFDKIYCQKMFVNRETCDKRICYSAGGFVQRSEGVYISMPLSGSTGNFT
ncbi:MAG: hypothetical protein LIO75_07730 [Lachnospiraceae bacterium]|nr:hypothetical protein [Lachnospiraceae bacterium]